MATAQADIHVQFPEWWSPVLFPARFKSVDGGRASTKSHGFAQTALLRMRGDLCDLGYPPPPVRIASARDFATSLDESVKILLEQYIKKWGLEYNAKTGDGEFIIHKYSIDHINGSHMFFPGVKRSVDSFLSMEDVDIFWMEQAELLGDEMAQVIPSFRKKTAELWFSWNPLTRTSWCWQNFKMNPRPGAVIITANWRDNPWFYETALPADREFDEEHNPEIYAWQWEGQPNDADGGATVLPYTMLATCVEAYRMGLAPDMDNAYAYAGFDLAEGGRDKCALVVRQGPIIRLVEQWPGVVGDTLPAANTAKDFCQPYETARIYYDGSTPIGGDLRRVGFKGVKPVWFGGEVGGADTYYEPRRKNKDVFARRNAQMADAVRLRGNRTVRLVRAVKEGRKPDVDPMQCLFIPPDLPRREEVLSEWTFPQRRLSPASGKWEIDKRGEQEESPDRYDALVLAFASETDGRGLKAR